MKAYLPDRRALAWFGRAADESFWTEHWSGDDLARRVRAVQSDDLFVPAVRRHLAPGSRVLEGGCGRGELVHALHASGYRVVGMDFARQVVSAVGAALPELALVAGDVRRLPFADASFDGCLSGGVIEHFWDGYGGILAELRRVLRPGGRLFITFPQMSPLRRAKARLGRYAAPEAARGAAEFYQFALPVREVREALEALGFRVLEERGCGGLKGFKDEVDAVRPWLQPIYDGRAGRRAKQACDFVLTPIAAHIAFLVLERRP